MSASESAPVIRFGRFEADLSAAGEYENPVQDVRVEVDFLGPGGERRTREAFWYGGKTWKVRFSPSQAGEWSYRTRSSVAKDEGLHGRAGSFTCVPGSASNPLYRRGRLQVSKDRRHLVHEDGTPFFWLADTAWNGPLKADAASFERYLDDRAAKGFNAVQFVATQWRSATGNADGRPAFYGRDKIAIDPEFYQWMDERLDAMNERGIVAAPVLIWAIGGRTAPLNPGQFLPDDQIVVLARYMVARWGAHHVVFFLAGDDDYRGEKAERWKKVGRAVFGEGAPGHLVTMHPGGRMWVAEEFRREPWFSFNGYQSGHGDAPEHLRWLTEGPPAQEWAKEPALPHINLEPNYEAHIARPSGKLFDAKAVRRAAYWSALATPTAGVSYGGHGVWSWELAPRLPMTHPYTGVASPWHEAIQLPGSIGMKHLKQVFTSLRWWTLRPEPDLVVDQPGRTAAEQFIAAARSQSGDAALLYVPEGGKVTLRTDRLAPPASASWFDPVTGARREAGRVVGRGVQRFEADPNQDWVLVIQSESVKASSPGPPADWRFHGGDPGHTQYSRLAQIHKGNVQRLKQAWVYRTGDARPDGRSQIQCHPIVVGSVLYATSPGRKAFALDAATGKQLWTFDPFPAGAPERSLGVSRGVVYWEEGEDKRILFSAGQRLFALDARTGQKVAAFGSNGSIDLRDGLDRDVSGLHVLSNTPGAIYRDLLILGSSVSEGPGPSAPGHVRAYDVRSGKIRWIFHTIPHPGEFGYDTWPKDAWTRSGGANAWSGISVDHARGLVFLPTGSAAFDFWGGDRHGANLFANCVLALDAATGKRVWHYQVVHHDLWDRDLPAAPVLVTVRHGGRAKDAVAQVTKSGHVFLLDRESGAPLFPVEEREAPASDLSGEAAWPTQPFPLKPPPFSRQTLTERDVTDLSPEARAHVLERLRRLKTGRPFLPPSKQGTVIFPGFDGGGEWGGAAFDPQTRLLYVNGNEMPWVLTMVEVGGESSAGKTVYEQHCASCHGVDRLGAPQQAAPPVDDLAGKWKKAQLEELLRDGKGVMPAFAFLSNDETSALADYLLGTAAPAGAPAARPADVRSPYTHTGYNRFLDPEGHPAVKPPWGTLNAIDLDKGEIAWTVTLGELPELTKRGIPPTGTENYGGPIVTAGGLVFIGATKDEKFRAFDKKTGKLLWEVALTAGGYATPSTYEAGGRQFVVIAAGGGKMGTKSGDAYVAFALPDATSKTP